MTSLILLLLLGAEPVSVCDDPNITLTVGADLKDCYCKGKCGAEPNVPTFPLTSLLDVGGVCRVEPDWQMYRAEEHKDKSCNEYAKVLTQFAEKRMHSSTAYLAYLSLCWLMDPCSKPSAGEERK